MLYHVSLLQVMLPLGVFLVKLGVIKVTQFLANFLDFLVVVVMKKGAVLVHVIHLVWLAEVGL